MDNKMTAVEPPNGFLETRAKLRAAITACRTEGLSQQAIVTVLLSEVMPLMVEAYGPRGVGVVLGRLSETLRQGGIRELEQ